MKTINNTTNALIVFLCKSDILETRMASKIKQTRQNKQNRLERKEKNEPKKE